MKTTTQAYLVIPIAIILVSGFLLIVFSSKPTPEPAKPEVPDFASIQDVNLKKQTFFEFMLPIVRKANEGIRLERRQLTNIVNTLSSNAGLSSQQASSLADMAIRYRVTDASLSELEIAEALLPRVDTIPASLVLAQAANESAWGSARFARDGNNYFGLWCWSQNCGLVPLERDSASRHEVAAFETIQDGVAYYLLTLNSHPAYELLREVRSTLKANNKSATGWDLAAGLLSYSERRETYIEEIREMIEYNDLHRYTRINYDH